MELKRPAATGRLSGWQRTAQGANLLSPDGGLGTVIFEEITALAAQHGAINLGQGYPDEDGPELLLNTARENIASGMNQYAPGRGLPVLREAVAAHQQRFYGLTIDPDREVAVTTGATEAIAASILAFAGPGDEVVTFEPFYDSYGAIIGLSGARHTTVPLVAPDFQPDLEALESTMNERTRVIVVNNPHNPMGTVFSRETLARVVELAERYDAIIVTDEVYEHLTFEQAHIPLAALPGAWERTISISSAGKTFSVTGWKIGWLTGPEPLVDSVRSVKSFLTYSSGTPFQPAVAAGLGMDDAFYRSIADSLKHKREVLAVGLRAAGFEVYTPQATYFTVVDAEPLGITDATALARRLAELVGVAAIPIPVFCHEDGARRTRSLLRFAFCKKEEVLIDAAERLATLRDRI